MLNQLSNEAKIDLIRRGAYSVDQFIHENEAMIKSATDRYTRGKFMLHHQWDEVLNAARYGFYKAMNDFKPELGYTFTTLAYKVMSYEIKNYFHRAIVVDNQIEAKHKEFDEELHDVAEMLNLLTYNLNTEGLNLTKRQQEIYDLYLTHQNYDDVAEVLGIRKQTVHESVKKTQARMREKYNYLFEFY